MKHTPSPIGALTNPCVSTSAAPVPPLYAGAATNTPLRAPEKVGGLAGSCSAFHAERTGREPRSIPAVTAGETATPIAPSANDLRVAVSIPTGGAGGANLSTCSDCNGTGEAMILALDATREEVGYCDLCQGTGEVEATCETCAGKLVDGWCNDCDDYGLVFVERISPTRIAL